MNPIEVEINSIDGIVIEKGTINKSLRPEGIEVVNIPLKNETKKAEIIEDIIPNIQEMKIENEIDEELLRLQKIHDAIMGILSTEDEYKSRKHR